LWRYLSRMSPSEFKATYAVAFRRTPATTPEQRADAVTLMQKVGANRVKALANQAGTTQKKKNNGSLIKKLLF
ncbi:hypothetical protein EBT31_22435, partial [bacterium]|nr:hypothetical protein [bacterium]